MPRLIQHRQEFRLGTFFKYLSTYGPFVDITSEVGHFPDEESARQRAQSLQADDPKLGFALRSDNGEYIGWIEDQKPRQAHDTRHEWINRGIQFMCLLLLSWLAIGYFNDGLFARSTLIGIGVVGVALFLASSCQNQCETFVAWIIIFTLILLTIPAHRAVEKAVERRRAAEQPTVELDRPPSGSR